MTDNFDTSYDYVQKFCIIGNASVGKSSVLVQLTDKRFIGASSEPTIGVEFGSRLIDLDNGQSIKLQIWDTAGQETYRSLTRSYYRGAEGILLCFDLSSRRSFVALTGWLDDLKQHAEESVVIILIGNKADIAAEAREVTEEEAQDWADSHNMEYLETSAKTGQNIEAAFENTARRIHTQLLANKAEMARKRKSRQGTSFPVISLTSGDSQGKTYGCC